MNHWIRPSCESRTGSSHLRRGAPCQDASGLHGFRDGDGQPVQVLVVSDGHGGSRYIRSDVGSRLACAVALREVERAMAGLSVAVNPQGWARWLAVELPAVIVSGWRQAVRQHWQEHPFEDAAAFSVVPYGATLGLLVLTPSWWGHTGLGDWDLVRIPVNGDAELVSEEPQESAAGEATYSLCLEDAAARCRSRSGLYPLRSADPAFSLLLSSDGIRKSCGTDADYLTLARYLVELPRQDGEDSPPELPAALDRISSQGSGDDVSVAMACWCERSRAASWPGPAERAAASIVQPPLSSPLPDAAAHRPLAVANDAGGQGQECSDVGWAVPPALSESRTRSEGRRPLPGGGRWSVTAVFLLVAGGLLAALGALLLSVRYAPGAHGGRPSTGFSQLSPERQQQLHAEVAALCHPSAPAPAEAAAVPASPAASATEASAAPNPDRGAPASRFSPAAAIGPSGASKGPGSGPTPMEPPGAMPDRAAGGSGDAATDVPTALGGGADGRRRARITTILSSRTRVFQELIGLGPSRAQPQVQALLDAGDPLSALIALSYQETFKSPPATGAFGWLAAPLERLAGLLAFLPGRGESPAAVTGPLAPLKPCPELLQALQDQWQRQLDGAAGIQPRPTGPAAPPPALPPQSWPAFSDPAPFPSDPGASPPDPDHPSR